MDYALLEGARALRQDQPRSACSRQIGVSHFATYFATVHRLLKPGGLYLHHAITRPGKRAAVKGGKKRPEFAALTRYIFPGGELDYLGRTITNLERHGFEVHDVEGWREHYQRTCRLWHDRLRARYDEACARSRRSQDARLAGLSRGLLDRVRARPLRPLPDALLQARQGRERPAADAGGFVSAALGAKGRRGAATSRAGRPFAPPGCAVRTRRRSNDNSRNEAAIHLDDNN